MNVPHEVTLIFAGLGAALVAASAAGYVLKRCIGGPMVENFNARIRTWWIMIAISAGVMLAGSTAIVLLFGCLSFLALREFVTHLPVRRAGHAGICFAFYIALPSQYLFVSWHTTALFTLFLPACAFLLVPAMASNTGGSLRCLRRSAETYWGVMICVYCLSYVPALLSLRIPGYEGRESMLVVFLILVTQASDVLQYIWGKLLGRRKIAPRLSPSKTVEGFFGGVSSATLLGAGLWWITPFSPMAAGAMALLVTLAGFLGGLVLSSIKRDRGIKDWGQLLEGHGGILDRLDSVCFSAPIFFHVTRYFFAL